MLELSCGYENWQKLQTMVQSLARIVLHVSAVAAVGCWQGGPYRMLSRRSTST